MTFSQALVISVLKTWSLFHTTTCHLTWQRGLWRCHAWGCGTGWSSSQAVLWPVGACEWMSVWTWVHCWWSGEEGSGCFLKSGFRNLWSLTCHYCCFWLSTRVRVTQSQVLFCCPSWSSSQLSLGLSSWLLHRHTLYLWDSLSACNFDIFLNYFYFSGIWKESQNTSLVSLQPLDFWGAPQ